MRLRIQFGITGEDVEVGWWKNLLDFPKLIQYQGSKWEWAMYNPNPAPGIDYVLTFSMIPSYDSNYSVDMPDFEQMFPHLKSDCDCGARHSSFPWDHMKFCKKWTKW